MKCCVSTDVGTWTNLLIFEPDLDHSPDIGTRLVFPILYRLRYFAALLERAVVLKWFYSLSRRKTFVGGECALPSALLVVSVDRRTVDNWYMAQDE